MDSNPGETTQVTLPQGADPGLVGSANPAGDMAAAAISKLFGGAAPQTAEPPAPAPAAQPPAPPAQPPAPAPAAQPPAPPAQPPTPVQPPAPATLDARYGAPDTRTQPEVPVLPDVPAETDIRLPENAPENIGHAFAAARAETRKFRQLAEQYRQEVEKVRADYSNYAQRESALAEKLRGEEAKSHDLEEKLGQLDLEQSPAFRAKYDAPLRSIQAEIAKTLVDAGGYQQQQADALAEQVVLAKDSNAVVGLEGFSELPATVQGMLMYKFNEADGLWSQRGQALESWRATREGLRQTETREGAVVSAQRRSELVSTGIDRVSKLAPQFIWNDPEFAGTRDSELEKVKAWYGQAPEDQIAAAAVEGALIAPFAYRMVQGLMDKVVELQGLLDAKRRVAAPPTVPYYRPPSVPAPAAPAKPAPTDDQPKSWTPVETAADPVAAAGAIVGDALKGMFQK